jgi:hypothetical protein
MYPPSPGILQQFNVACRYQEQTSNALSALVLDEVGLAEFSPDMPLKASRVWLGRTDRCRNADGNAVSVLTK